MPSAAFRQFEEVFDRGLTMVLGSVALYDFFKGQEIEGFPGSYDDAISFSDMGRSGLVIAVGAMDAYFTDRFCENLVAHLRSGTPNRKLVELLEDAGIDVVSCLRMFSMERPFRRVRNILNDHLQNLVTQRFEAIDGLYKCYSITSITTAVEKRTGRTTLLRSVKNAVHRRHKIVHRGDLNAHRRLASFDPQQAIRRLGHIRVFVAAADQLLDERFKT